MLRRYRHADDPRAAAIAPDDFHLRDDGLDAALDLVAVCSSPRPVMRACVWCGAPLEQSAVRQLGRIRCAACGAATIDPWPTDEELSGAYGAWYRPESGRRFGVLGDELLRRTRGSLAARLDAIAPPGPVLDVGAGDGTLIDALARRGRAATGLERAAAREDLRHEPIEEMDGEWAAVVFWHSLEHLPAPGEAIRHAARLLAPGGVVVVAVPDGGSLQARAFGDRWLHLDRPRHLVHLTGARAHLRPRAPRPARSSACRPCAAARSSSAGSTASSAPCRAA